MDKVFTFYSPEGAAALAAALATFDGGRLVVNVVDMPIKCPVAPLEFCFLADWYFRERGIRDQVQLTYVTPLDGAFTKPVASTRLAGMLAEKGVELVTEFNTGEVDGAGGRSSPTTAARWTSTWPSSFPLHGGAPYVGRSPGLGDELNFVPTDEHTLQSKAAPNVFVIGDAANVPASKAGSVTHFEGEVLVENIRRYLAGEPLDAGFDGHTNCFIETGLPQGAAHRLQLRHRALARPLPDPASVCRCWRSPVSTTSGSSCSSGSTGTACCPAATSPGSARPCPTAGKIPANERLEKGLTMSTMTIAATDVELNDEGFFVRPEQWTEDMVPELARREGIDELTDAHWQVIRFMRSEYLAKGTGPTVRVLGKTSGVSIKELYQLFPKGPAKVAAKIAGIPKPRGCI